MLSRRDALRLAGAVAAAPNVLPGPPFERAEWKYDWALLTGEV